MSFQDVQSGGGGWGRKASAFPSQAVAAGIFQINTAVGTFRRLVDAIGTAKDTPDHRQKLHNTRQRVLELVKDTSAKLKSLTQSDHQSNVNPSKQIEDAKLARDFQTTLQEFQKVQQLASERESTYMPSLPTSAASASASGEYLEPSSGSTRDQHRQPFLQDQKRQELLLLDNEVAFNEAIIEEREQGIRDIEAQIGEASEIFKDLAVLVHEQGVVIDDIQSNIDNSSAATTQARVQLAKASKGVKSRCSWCWWVLVVLVVVVVIVVIVLII
ncbi:hypothetical protein ACFX13_023548 [Malus domestica]|uniref:syntaxin-22-like isoform X1 n=1 Tax=Malus sylvestris TaxID=3752 RepID=UPI0004990987|nr:syntaxin-22-like isoform X1 [Malus domestica]XP_050135138.1 syntaxin-22-like isoform X1 [Malus sylvestris]